MGYYIRCMGIHISDIEFGYTKQKVLKGISFDAENSSLLAVLGPNGVGKTTLFRCILGLEKKYQGAIEIDGEDTRNMEAKRLSERIAYIPQIRQQVFGFSVLDMVLMGTTNKVKSFGVPGQKEVKNAEEVLDKVNIGYLAKKDYGKISGGEQQLVLIARALAQHSKNLLMDEPTSALDYGNQTKVLDVVRSLADSGYCIVLSTHNPQHALWYADKALAIADGKVAACGEPYEIMTEELIEKLYGIDVKLLDSADGRLISPMVRRKK